MKLIQARVKMFRHILDSTDVLIQPDVTCLVGKNESGKTAFLQALQLLNPERPNTTISAARQYPAWLEKKHRRNQNLENFQFVSGLFQLEQSDFLEIETYFGKGALKSDTWTLSRSYDGKRTFYFQHDDSVVIKYIIEVASENLLANFPQPKNLSELDALIETLNVGGNYESAPEDGVKLSDARQSVIGDSPTIQVAIVNLLDRITPKFFYFADYISLPGSIKIRDLLKADRKTLSDDELTALSLLELAGAESEYLLEPDYETRKRELENVANSLTEDILNYWTTNNQIRVEIDITQKTIQTDKNISTQHGYSTVTEIKIVLDELKI